MRELKRYDLPFEEAKKFFIETLENANTLSSKLLDLVNFESGKFFTLMPKEANIGKLTQYKSGFVLPEQPKKEYFLKGKTATYSNIPNIREEIAEFITNEIIKKDYSWIADDVIRLANDKTLSNLIQKYGVFFENEIYYLVNRKNYSKEIVLDCLNASMAIWHSLSLLTMISPIRDHSKFLKFDMIQQICDNVYIIIVGAYDGEGYIFWEKMK